MINLQTLSKFLKTLDYNWQEEVSPIIGDGDNTPSYYFMPASEVGINKLVSKVYVFRMTDKWNNETYKLINLSHSDFVMYNFDLLSGIYTHIDGDFSEDWILFQARESEEDLDELLEHFNSLNNEASNYYDSLIAQTEEQIKSFTEQLEIIKKEKHKTKMAFNSTIAVLKKAGYKVKSFGEKDPIEEDSNEDSNE